MRKTLTFLCVLAVVAIASPAWAAYLSFTDANTNDSNWTTAGNWIDDLGGTTTVPGGSNVDTVYMGGNKTCILNSNAGTMKRLHGSYDTNLGTLQLETGAYLEVWTYSFFGMNGPAKVVQNGGTMDMSCNQDWPWGSPAASMYELNDGRFLRRISTLTYWLIDGDGGSALTCYFKQAGGEHNNAGAMEVAVGALTGSTAEVELSGGTTFIDEFSLMRKGLGGSEATGTGTGILNVVGSGSAGITFTTYLQANPGDGLDAVLECEIDAGGITTINVTGTATFEDGCILDMEIASGLTLTPGQTFDLMKAPDGGITGMPTLKAEDVATWTVAIVSGSDILQATYVPEPATLVLLSVGLLGVVIRRKRR